MPTEAVAVTNFSTRNFEVQLRDEVRTLAARLSGIEGRFVSIEEAHNKVVRRGVEAMKTELRERKRRERAKA